MRRYRLCFLGFGNVGRALARLLVVKAAELRENYGIEWRSRGWRRGEWDGAQATTRLMYRDWRRRPRRTGSPSGSCAPGPTWFLKLLHLIRKPANPRSIISKPVCNPARI